MQEFKMKNKCVVERRREGKKLRTKKSNKSKRSKNARIAPITN